MTRRSVLAAAVAGLAIALAAGHEVRAQAPSPTAAAGLSLEGLSPQVVDSLIASARPDAPATLSIANREVVVLRAAIVGRTAAERVAAAGQILAELAAEGKPLPVARRQMAAAWVITVGERDVFVIVPVDADELLGETADAKAAATVVHLQQALDETIEARRPHVLMWAGIQAALATIAFVLLLVGLRRANDWAGGLVERATTTKLSRSSMGDQLVHQTRLLLHMRRAVTASLVVAGLSMAFVWATFSLRRFPYTRPWGESLRGFLLERMISFGQGVIDAVPGLFTIVLIVIVTRVVARLVHHLFAAVEEGRTTLPWIYPETVAPTRKLVTALLWVLAVVACYPYMPWSGTEAFKGVSVLLGLGLSLGSRGIVEQSVSGFTVIYSRALRAGDYVLVGDVEGTVVQIGTLSTKIETPRHEEVTIPNAVLISQTVVNYSRYAESTGVFVPTEVTIGYDAPWRQVEALLLLAASRTAGLRRAPAPVVRQVALEDFYVRYRLMACLEVPRTRGPVLDELHANIQDAFNEYGVQIMSPNYEADPGAPKVVPRDQWFAAPAGSSIAKGTGASLAATDAKPPSVIGV